MDGLSSHIAAIERLCRSLDVRELDVFGAAIEDFGSAQDVDILVRFEGEHDLFDRFFDLKEGLEGLFGMPVDLVVERAIKNPYFRQAVENSKQRLSARRGDL